MNDTLALLAVLALGVTPIAGQVSTASLTPDVAKIDQIAADPDAKLPLLHAMALDLGTHRNHLILLKKQTGRTFAEIYVTELRGRGLDDDAILKKLRSIQSRMAPRTDSEQSARGFRPIAYVGASVDRNSAGTFTTVSPELGIDTRRLAIVLGIPIYRIAATQREATGIGDAYASVFVRKPAGRYDLGAALTLSAPTGEREQGLGAGRVSVDLNGTLQRRFERFRPFISGGFTNSVFNNVGYQRPFISNGNALYTSGGIDYRFHRRLTVGVGGFGLHAFGTHTLISRMTSATHEDQSSGMPPGHMPPGSGTGMLGAAPMPSGSSFYGQAQQTAIPGQDLADNGLNGWASWSVHPEVTITLTVARSIPYELTTVRVALGFSLSRPFSRLLRR
jgi:hypothetical protein